MQDRFDRISDGLGIEIPDDDRLQIINANGHYLNRKQGFLYYENLVKAIKPHVLIIDSLYASVYGNISETSVANNVVDAYKSLRKANPFMNIFFVHHTKKKAEDQDYGRDEMLGAQRFAMDANIMFRMKGMPHTEEGATLTTYKVRDGMIPKDLDVKLDPYSLLIKQEDEVVKARPETLRRRDLILEIVSHEQPITMQELMKHTDKDVAYNSLRRMIIGMKELGQLAISRNPDDIRRPLISIGDGKEDDPA